MLRPFLRPAADDGVAVAISQPQQMTTRERGDADRHLPKGGFRIAKRPRHSSLPVRVRHVFAVLVLFNAAGLPWNMASGAAPPEEGVPVKNKKAANKQRAAVRAQLKKSADRFLSRVGVGLRQDGKGKVVAAEFPPRASYSYARFLKNYPKLRSINFSRMAHFSNRGLQYLAQADNLKKTLQELNLARCSSVTDKGLGYISGMTELTTLDLSYCKHISDAGIAKLKSLKKLKSLNLNYCRSLTDKSLEHLAALKNLEVLHLRYCRNITEKGWAQLKSLPKLRELNLGYTSIDDAGLKAIAGIPTLKSLSLRSCKNVTAAGVKHLADGKAKLETLSLAYVRSLNDSNISLLKDFRSLSSLNLRGLHLSERGLKHVAGLSKLRTLYLRYVPVTDAGLKELATMKSLEELTFRKALFTDKGLEHLRSLPELTSLEFAQCQNASTAGFAVLKNLKKLEHLRFYGMKVNDKLLEYLKDHKQLTSLELQGCPQLTAGAMKTIGAMKQLKRLNLSHNNWVNRNSLKELAALSDLRELDLSSCRRVTSSGIRYLQGLKKLETLSLQNCSALRSVGIAYLSGMKNLRDVDVNGTQVTSSTLRHVRRNLPQAKVAGVPKSSGSSARGNVERSKVTVLIIGDFDNAAKRRYFRQLKKATGEERLLYYLIAETAEGTRLELAPVADIHSFAKQIDFGEVTVEAGDKRSIKVHPGKQKESSEESGEPNPETE